MLVSLLARLAPALTDEEPDKRGGVVLRREQVKRVLFEGKAAIVENDVVIGKYLSPHLYLNVDCL